MIENIEILLILIGFAICLGLVGFFMLYQVYKDIGNNKK